MTAFVYPHRSLSKRSLAALTLLMLLCPPAARAMINPSFTPVDLIRQSDVILHIRFERVNDDGSAVARVLEVLKGRESYDADEVRFDFLAGAFEAQGREAMDVVRKGQTEGLMFIGRLPSLKQVDGSGGGDDDTERAFLHLGARGPWSAKQWVVLEKWKDGWDMMESRSFLLGTWAGGTDMLLRAVRYIQSDPEARVPVFVGVQWDKAIAVGRIDGKLAQLSPIDLDADGRCELFLASDAGDRVYRFASGTLIDITPSLGLTTRSRAAAWSDFNADGQADLASYDGDAIHILLSRPGRGLVKSRSFEVGPDVLGLDALDVGAPGLLVSRASGPTVMKVAPASIEPISLPEPELPFKQLGSLSRCLVGDLDADGKIDLLQPYAKGSLLYRGLGPGTWAKPEPVDVFLGQGRHGACLVDLDQDGKLDVMAASEDFCRLWQNRGKGNFEELLELSGEIGYISKPGGIACQGGDVNNDGLQDVLIVYPGTMNPQLFFNRCYRSFGHARELDVSGLEAVPIAACLGEFTGDGALDMVVVLPDGAIRLLPRGQVDDPPLAAVVSLTADSGTVGPVSVRASVDTRDLGAWSVSAGGPPAVIGVAEPMEIHLRWRSADGQDHEVTVVPEEAAIRVRLAKP